MRAGRYVEAVARGNLLLGMCEPSRVQVATIHRAPLEAYVTLSAHGSAAAACTESIAVHRGFKRVCGEVRKANGSPIMRIFGRLQSRWNYGPIWAGSAREGPLQPISARRRAIPRRVRIGEAYAQAGSRGISARAR